MGQVDERWTWVIHAWALIGLVLGAIYVMAP